MLTEEDFNRALGYGFVDKSVINKMQNNLTVYKLGDPEGYSVDNKDWYLDIGTNRATLEELNPETYFVDNEQNNKEQESTTLVKNR